MDTADRGQIDAGRVRAFFEAIAEGNLNRVKLILAEDPDLLFADLDDRSNSPAIEALDSGHPDVTDFLAREELRRVKDGTVPPKDLYGAIHDLGEVAHAGTGYPLAEQLRAEAESVVVQFLHHEDESFRYIALNVLGLHWDLRRHRETFQSMMLDDPDDDVRRMAVACLGHVLRGSRDWEASRSLLGKLRDRTEQESVKHTAYEALLETWFGSNASHRQFVKIMEARRPLERASDEAGGRGDWTLASEMWQQAGRVWQDHVDWEFIAKLERGEEP